MAPVACNDAELAAMLAPPVMRGLQAVGEMFIEPEIGVQVGMHTGRGSIYQAHTGASGSLSRAWTTKTTVGSGFNLGVMETYYDSGKLTYDASIGQHITPNLDSEDNYRHVYNAGVISDMASLIIQGGGGMLFGPDNPTRIPSDFWTPLLQQVRANERRWVTAGLRMAGLSVM